MISNAAGILVFLLLCGIVASNPDRPVDCRKFVFAPLCRGVAAKRNVLSPGRYEPAVLINDDGNELLGTSFDAALLSLGVKREDEGDKVTGMSAKNEMDNIRRMYQQDRINRFLRLLIESRKGSSERDNFTGQEFENL